MVDHDRFDEEFRWFKRLIAKRDNGRAFTNFDEGLVHEWEGYKPRLRDQALRVLSPGRWTEAEIGSGSILQRTIEAIQIKENNLVDWHHRRGPGTAKHTVLLDARQDATSWRELERYLFDLFKDVAGEGTTFGLLKDMLGDKYSLLAYLFFLKDMDRFMPIQPMAFDCAFRDLGIDLKTARKCSWENYQRFNDALRDLQSALTVRAGLGTVRLIDAHSFCWMLGNPLKKEREQLKKGREKSIVEMRRSVESTVRNSNGQTVKRIVKNKELRGMTPEGLTDLIRSLLDRQRNRCALTKIPFHFAGPGADDDLRPSVDRIDSNGHYEAENVQIVCRFVNLWKGDSENDEFKRLLALVRGDTPPHLAASTPPTEDDTS